MREITDKCNVCRRTRTSSNHYFLMVEPANASPYFIEWDDHRAGEDGIGHICGVRCAHQAIDAWFNARQQELMESRRADLQSAPMYPVASPSQFHETSSQDPGPAADTVALSEKWGDPASADLVPGFPDQPG